MIKLNQGGTKLENLAIGERTLRAVAGNGVELRSPSFYFSFDPTEN